MLGDVLTRHPTRNKLICETDNATCYASQMLIPFIFNFNRASPDVKIIKWIYTEAQTGKGRLDTHFSYINTLFKSYVADDNNISTETEIMNAMQFSGGIAGTSVIHLNLSKLKGPILNKTFK